MAALLSSRNAVKLDRADTVLWTRSGHRSHTLTRPESSRRRRASARPFRRAGALLPLCFACSEDVLGCHKVLSNGCCSAIPRSRAPPGVQVGCVGRSCRSNFADKFLVTHYDDNMKIVALPGLDGTGLLTPKLRHVLDGGHSVTSLAYPSHLCRYEEVFEWTKSQIPKEDFVLVAESFSGPIGIHVGAEKPPGLKGIVFVAIFARSPRKLPAFLAALVKIMPFRSSLIANMAQPILMGKRANRTFTAQFLQAMHNVPQTTLSKRLVSVLKVDVVDVLQGIDVPVLYLRATKDRLVPARMARDFELSNGTVQDIEGPHFLLQACTDQTDMHIARFIANLGEQH